jgi:hypothetical protein
LKGLAVDSGGRRLLDAPATELLGAALRTRTSLATLFFRVACGATPLHCLARSRRTAACASFIWAEMRRIMLRGGRLLARRWTRFFFDACA